jgi:transcriptional regulator with XRE-family HTH domain
MRKTISELIKEKRERLGITQKEMGEFLGMEQSGYAKLEKKGDFIPYITIRKICEMLKCNPIQLVIETEPERVRRDSEYKSMVLDLLDQINAIQASIRKNESDQWKLQRDGLLKQMKFLQQLKEENPNREE